MLKMKRVYEDADIEDGFRVLTERLWPRGVTKERAKLDQWMKNIAPGNDLRKWFDHDFEKWDEFKDRYRKELYGSETVNELLDIVRNHKNVTLVYASKDEEYNSTAVLKKLLEDLME